MVAWTKQEESELVNILQKALSSYLPRKTKYVFLGGCFWTKEAEKLKHPFTYCVVQCYVNTSTNHFCTLSYSPYISLSPIKLSDSARQPWITMLTFHYLNNLFQNCHMTNGQPNLNFCSLPVTICFLLQTPAYIHQRAEIQASNFQD